MLLTRPRKFYVKIGHTVTVTGSTLTRERNDDARGPELCYLRGVIRGRAITRRLDTGKVVFMGSLSRIPSNRAILFDTRNMSPTLHRRTGEHNLEAVSTAYPFIRHLRSTIERCARRNCVILLVNGGERSRIINITNRTPCEMVIVRSRASTLDVRFPRNREFIILARAALSSSFVRPVVGCLQVHTLGVRLPSEDKIYGTAARERETTERVTVGTSRIVMLNSPADTGAGRLTSMIRRAKTVTRLLPSTRTIHRLVGAKTFENMPVVKLATKTSAPRCIIRRTVRVVGQHFTSR